LYLEYVLLLLRVARSLIQKDIVVIFDSKNINFKALTNGVNEVLFRAESPTYNVIIFFHRCNSNV